jgi:ParB-like chromosome segregation protein Spo0J
MQPELVVSTLSVAALVPYAENARAHLPSQVAQIAGSITELGFIKPVLIDAEGCSSPATARGPAQTFLPLEA